MCVPVLQDLAHHAIPPYSNSPNNIEPISMNELWELRRSSDTLFKKTLHLSTDRTSGDSLSTTQASSSSSDSFLTETEA